MGKKPYTMMSIFYDKKMERVLCFWPLDGGALTVRKALLQGHAAVQPGGARAVFQELQVTRSVVDNAFVAVWDSLDCTEKKQVGSEDSRAPSCACPGGCGATCGSSTSETRICGIGETSICSIGETSICGTSEKIICGVGETSVFGIRETSVCGIGETSICSVSETSASGINDTSACSASETTASVASEMTAGGTCKTSTSDTSETKTSDRRCGRKRALVMVLSAVGFFPTPLQRRKPWLEQGLTIHNSVDLQVQLIDRVVDVIIVQLAFRGVGVHVVIQRLVLAIWNMKRLRVQTFSKER